MGGWGDFADALDFIGDMLDLFGIGGGEVEELAEAAIERNVIVEIGHEGFGLALDLTGNPGQATIIGQMGPEPYIEAAFAAADGEDAVDVLFGSADHPDAVEQILEEAGAYINDAIEDIQD